MVNPKYNDADELIKYQLKQQWDSYTLEVVSSVDYLKDMIYSAYLEGHEEGFEEGKEVGFEEGREDGAINSYEEGFEDARTEFDNDW